MSPHLEARLIKEFPELCQHLVADPDRWQQPIGAYGFEIADGWFPIIYSLSASIQSLIDHRPKVIANIKEWNERVARGEVDGERQPVPRKIKQVSYIQVKSKFGRLTIYTDSDDAIINAYVTMAERMAMYVDHMTGNTKINLEGTEQ